MLRPSRTAITLATASLGALAFAGPGSAAVPLGTQSDQLGQWSTPATPTGTVLATLHDTRPGHYVTAPEDGVITSWRSFEFSGTATASLVVLQRTTGTDEMRIVSSSLPVTATTEWFGGKTQLPIRAGQQVGIQVLGTYGFSHFFWSQNVPALNDPGDPNTGSYAAYDDLVPGGPPHAPRANSTVTDAVFQLQAVVEPDADGDGFGDETQDLCPGDPTSERTDTDGDGLGDACDPDADGDDLPNADEATHGTDPLKADSDDDGLRDGEEITRGTDPLKADSDDDGVDDRREVALGLDPLRSDTDGDGFGDGDDRCPLVTGTDGGCPTEPESPPTVTTTVTTTVATPAVTTTVEREPSAPAPAPAPKRETVGRARPGAVASRSTVRRRGAATTVATRGKVRRPAGLDAASACRGPVSVQVKRGRVTLSMRRVALDRSCRFRSTVRFGARVRSGDRLRVHVTFGGNRAVEGRRAAIRTVVVR